MLKVIWNIFKSILGVIFSIFRPLRRLWCRRRKPSESDGSELTSIGTGTLMMDTPAPYGQEDDGAEIEMEAWDNWEVQGPGNSSYNNQSQSLSGHPAYHSNSSQFSPYGLGGQQSANGGSRLGQNQNYNQKHQQPEPEPEINFFEDMTPDVKKQPKILIRKKESSPMAAPSTMSNRLAVMSDVPFQNSELEAWEDENNAWDSGEALEDITWQAEEAIKEKKRKERIERQMEQQKRKQKKDEMRGLKSGGSLIATKIS